MLDSTLTGLAAAAEKIWQAALAAVAPSELIRRSVRLDGDRLEIHSILPEHPSLSAHSLEYANSSVYDLAAFENIYLISFGKAAPAMSGAFLDILGDRVKAGLVVSLPGQTLSLPRMTILEAPHPLPDERSSRAARAALDLARGAGGNDLLVILLSGGGSAQVALPRPPVSFDEKRRLTGELMLRGADIGDLNRVRKHLSAVKGGLLAKAAFPAALAVLAVSDVVGDDPGSIASGPAHWDSSTFEDVRRVLRSYGLWDGAPRAVKELVEEGRAGRTEETLKKGDRVFEKTSAYLIGNNAAALDAARRQARDLGFSASILTSSEQGEARDVAKRYAGRLAELVRKRAEAGNGKPLCLLSGGELTVRVTGGGRGGRNQEFALGFLAELERLGMMDDVRRAGARNAGLAAGRAGVKAEGCENGNLGGMDWLVASLGTDGIDGNTDAAGAWASPEIYRASRRLGLDMAGFLSDNDSHRFFEQAGGLIRTGPTGTNVMDIRLLMAGQPFSPALGDFRRERK
jgi:glycerate 2-kinase